MNNEIINEYKIKIIIIILYIKISYQKQIKYIKKIQKYGYNIKLKNLNKIKRINDIVYIYIIIISIIIQLILINFS